MSKINNLSELEDDIGYQMFVDGEVRMCAKGNFYKAIANHPKVKEYYEKNLPKLDDIEVWYEELM